MRTLHLIIPTCDRFVGDLGSDTAYEAAFAWLLWKEYPPEVALEISAWSEKAKVGDTKKLYTIRAEVLDTPAPIPPWTFNDRVEPGSTSKDSQHGSGTDGH